VNGARRRTVARALRLRPVGGAGLCSPPETQHAPHRDTGSIARFSQRASPLVGPTQRAHVPPMFVVTEAEAAAIRAVYEQQGEFSAAVELRRQFPGITDNAHAVECARIIAAWKPLPLRPVMPKPPRLRQVR
jgi:hypothetical protein